MPHRTPQLGLVIWVALIGTVAYTGFGSISEPVQLALAYGVTALVLAWIFYGLFHGFAHGSTPTLFGLPSARSAGVSKPACQCGSRPGHTRAHPNENRKAR